MALFKRNNRDDMDEEFESMEEEDSRESRRSRRASRRNRDADEEDSRGSRRRRRRGRNEDDFEEEVEEQEAPREESRRDKKKNKRKSKNELLSSVLDESVDEASLAELRANSAFTTVRPETGVTCHIGWLLNTEDIGGLSRKTASRDEAKGSIVECIRSGRIKVIATEALMAYGYFILIPDVTTIDAADEFGILRSAPYTAAFIDDEGDHFTRIDTPDDIKVSFKDAQDVLAGDISIDELLDERKQSGFVVESEREPIIPSADGLDRPRSSKPASEPTVDLDEVDDFVDVYDESELNPMADMPMDSSMGQMPTDEFAAVAPEMTGAHARPAMDELPDIDIDEDVAFGGAPVYPPQYEEQPYEQPQQPQYPVQDTTPRHAAPEPEATIQSVADNANYQVSFEEFTEQLNRMFYSDELPFEVSLQPFNATFVQGNKPPEFPVERGEGWLAEQLSQMSMDANADLARLHEDNITYLRTRYEHLMGLYIDGLVRRLDVNDSDTRFGVVKAELNRERDNKLSTIESEVANRVRELDAHFEEQVKHEGEIAAKRAESQYRQRHERDREARRGRIISQVRAEIDAEYHADLDAVLELRRDEAAKRIDYGVTSVLGILIEQYEKLRAQEMERYDQYRDSFAQWIDENRKEDIAYAQTLAEDQRQGEKAERLRAEYDQQFAQQAAEFERKKQQLEAEIAESNRSADARIEDIKRRHAEELERAYKERDEVNERLQSMMDRYDELDEQKDQQYASRMKVMQDRIDADTVRYAALERQHKHTSILWIAVAVVAIACALFLGMLIGFNQHVNDSMQSTIIPIADVIDVDAEVVDADLE